MKDAVYRAYNFEFNARSLLKFGEIKRYPDEIHNIFFERLLDHFYQHLVGPNVAAAGYNTGPHGDTMTMSQANIVAMIWLERIDKRLLKLVQSEYSIELGGNMQLVQLVPRIADNMDVLLAKLDENKTINRVRRVGSEFGGRGRERDRNNSGRRERANTGRGGSGGSRARDVRAVGRGREDRGSRRGQNHCSHCLHLSKELQFRIPHDHSPLHCQRKNVTIRMMKDSYREQENEYDTEPSESEEEEHQYSDQEEDTGNGDYRGNAPLSPSLASPNFSSFQTTANALPSP